LGESDAISILGRTCLTRFLERSILRRPRENPCAAQPTQPGWRVFVDKRDGFCFEYPGDYKRVTAMLASRPCGVKQGCLLSLKKNPPPSVPPRDQDAINNASINLSSLRIQFHLDLLTRYAPTGYQDTPPQPVRVGGTTFHYYGPGGGGVAYPDQFFFEVNGQAFSIDFTGPYTNDKTPADVTKQIEKKLLASFHRF
jgi:hypothetical protein